VISTGYAAAVPEDLSGSDLRYVPTFSRGVDKGAALRVVPERVGAMVAEVLASI
jgi:hypothetical protein